MNPRFTTQDKEELDMLYQKQNDHSVPMMEDQQNRMKFLQDKQYHNCCLNPHCTGHVGRDKDRTCTKCNHQLHKMKKK